MKYIYKGLIGLFCIPILSVWFAGSLICSVIAVIAGVLRTFGIGWIGMTIYPGVSVPESLSLPFGLCLAAVLMISFYYTRRFLRRCLLYLRTP